MSAPPPLASWYCAATLHEVQRAGTLRRPFCHRDLVLEHRGGQLHATIGEQWVPVVVRDDAVMVWFHPEGEHPTFDLPVLARGRYSDSRFDFVHLATRPEHVMRDLADYAHFQGIHEYSEIEVEEDFSAAQHRCSLTVSFAREVIPGVEGSTLPSRFTSTCWGVGYQVTEVAAPGGVQSRHRVLPTPTLPGQCRVTLGVEVGLASPVGRIPGPRRLLRRYVRGAFKKDVLMDAQLWVAVPGEQRDRQDETLARFWDWAGRFAA